LVISLHHRLIDLTGFKTGTNFPLRSPAGHPLSGREICSVKFRQASIFNLQFRRSSLFSRWHYSRSAVLARYLILLVCKKINVVVVYWN